MFGSRKKEFPANREFIGTVHTGQGEIRVYMPTLRDMCAVKSDNTFTHRLCAAAINVTYEEFMDMSYLDTHAIITLVCQATEVLKARKETTPQ